MNVTKIEKISLIIFGITFLIFIYGLVQGNLMSIGFMIMIIINVVLLIIRKKKEWDN